MKDCKPVENSVLSFYLFIKDGVIRVNLVYCENDTMPIKLFRNEIEKIIDDKYTQINGYYRLNRYKGSPFGDFLVNREELAGLLEEKYVFVPAGFIFGTNIDNKNLVL